MPFLVYHNFDLFVAMKNAGILGIFRRLMGVAGLSCYHQHLGIAGVVLVAVSDLRADYSGVASEYFFCSSVRVLYRDIFRVSDCRNEDSRVFSSVYRNDEYSTFFH